MVRSICAATLLTLVICSWSAAQISGKVTLLGAPPESKPIKEIASNPQCAQLHKDPVYEDTVLAGDKGELANVIVFIMEDKPGDLKGPRITTPATLRQKGCMYSPHVLAVEIGQPVVVVNSDPCLHSVHGATGANKPFNFVQINAGQNNLDPFTAAETVQIHCDVHPWMKAVVRVFDHPFFAVTGENGTFSIDTKGLKDGVYRLQTWHEVYKDSLPPSIEIKDGKASRQIEFTYKSNAKG